MAEITRKILISTLLSFILLTILGCRCKKEVIREVASDSTNTQVVIRVEKEIDTVFVELPSEEKERTTRDSSSFLENKYATSLAKIDTNGNLFHNLVSKNINVPVKVDKEIVYRDSIHTVYKYREKQVPVEVEKKLTIWQTMSLKAFPWILAAFLGLIAYLFRNPLFSLIRRLLSRI